MSFQNYDNLIKFLSIFDNMSRDLNIGRLTNHEKDVLLNLHKYKKSDNKVNIREVDFINFYGKPIAKSSLYKSLKSLCLKKIIKHLGSERSSIYKLN